MTSGSFELSQCHDIRLVSGYEYLVHGADEAYFDLIEAEVPRRFLDNCILGIFTFTIVTEPLLGLSFIKLDEL